MAVVIFHKNLFLTPKIGFLCFAAKTIEPPWRRHTHAPKLVSPVINLYHQGLKLVQSTASALNYIYDFLGGCTTPPIPPMPGSDVSQRRVNQSIYQAQTKYYSVFNENCNRPFQLLSAYNKTYHNIQ